MKNRIMVLRVARDWSQRELAEHLDVSRRTVSTLERGRFDPSLPMAFRISSLFGIPIHQIFLGSEACADACASTKDE